MANSDLWRELAFSFKSVPEFYEFTAYRQYYMELQYFSLTSKAEPDWKLQAIPPALAEFDAMARRGATMLTPPPTGDLAVAWLEALWKEATEGPVRSGIPIVGKDRTGRLTELRGTIARVFEASSALCRKFESEALQAEFVGAWEKLVARFRHVRITLLLEKSKRQSWTSEEKEQFRRLQQGAANETPG